jgi:hypothetical protein
VLVLPSLEVACQPNSWCVSAGKEQNVKIECDREKDKCEAILECIINILLPWKEKYTLSTSLQHSTSTYHKKKYVKTPARALIYVAVYKKNSMLLRMYHASKITLRTQNIIVHNCSVHNN